MKNKYTNTLIQKFFEKNVSKDLQLKFMRWFVERESRNETRESMSDIWDNISPVSDSSTSVALKKMHKKISDYEYHKKRALHTRLAWIAVILLPILSITGAFFLKKETIIIKEPELVEHFVQHVEREKIILPDSSEVWLNSGSLLIYEKSFEGSARTVLLNGEAYFTVTENKEKPFIVKTHDIVIEVLGTIFNIESYADREFSITTLEKGKVKVNTMTADSEPIYLSPNEQLIYNKTSKTFEKKEVSVARENLWAKGYLVFKSSSFDGMMKAIERRYDVKINYNKDLYKGRIFTTRFSPEENVNQVFNILKDICGFNYTINNNIIYITNKKEDKP